MDMDSVQIKGVDSTIRTTEADLKEDASLVIHERIMTHGQQKAETDFTVDLNGAHSSANVVSRSVAKEIPTRSLFLIFVVIMHAADIQNVMPSSWTMERWRQFRLLQRMISMQH